MVTGLILEFHENSALCFGLVHIKNAVGQTSSQWWGWRERFRLLSRPPHLTTIENHKGHSRIFIYTTLKECGAKSDFNASGAARLPLNRSCFLFSYNFVLGPWSRYFYQTSAYKKQQQKYSKMNSTK